MIYLLQIIVAAENNKELQIASDIIEANKDLVTDEQLKFLELIQDAKCRKFYGREMIYKSPKVTKEYVNRLYSSFIK